MIIDTHCHLNFNLFQDDLTEVLARATENGVERIIVPATDIESSLEAIELSHAHPGIYAAVGIHPNDAGDFTLKDIDRLHDLAMDTHVIAIGEIGLDRYHDDVSFPDQMIAFEAQLDLAQTLHLPVLVHNREADQDMVSVLKKCFSAGGTIPSGILHSFSSPVEIADLAIELGFYLGVGGPITYKNAAAKRDVIRDIRRDRIVLETDAPFLAPQRQRGNRNEPAFTVYVVEELAKLWEVPTDEVIEITTQNAARIFQWNNLN